MKLDLKARQYKMLCDKFEAAKQSGVNPNGPEMQRLLEEFQENNKEIVNIKKQLRDIKESEPELYNKTLPEEQQVLLNQYGLEDLFQNMERGGLNKSESNCNMVAAATKKNILSIILDKIKRIFNIG